MKQFITKSGIFALLAMLTLPCFAQEPDKDEYTRNMNSMGLFTQEQIDERDAINRSSLLKEQSRSAWSMDIDPNKYYWDIPIPDYSTPTMPTQKQGGFDYDYSPVRTPESKEYYQREKDTRDRITNNQIKNLRQGNAYTQANIERTRAIGEANRLKREAENARDRERGRRDYYVRTAGFHAYNAARDQWMATEGVRHLKEDVHAMDMASVPQTKQENKLNLKSGNELADLLKEQEEEEVIVPIKVIIVERNDKHENQNGVSLNSENNVTDFYGYGNYNQSDIDSWGKASFSTNGFIPTNIKRKNLELDYDKFKLFSKNELDISCFDITTLPGMGCVILLGDSIVLLDTPDLQILEWGKRLQLSDIITCGARTFGKQSNTILEITKEQTHILSTFKTNDFSIFNETDSSFIMCMRDFDLTIVNRINVETNTYDELLRITQPIEKIVANSNVILTKCGFKIIDITLAPTLFYSSKERINDFCMCPDGLLVATDKDVVLLQSQEKAFTFSKKGAKRLWCDGIDIYIQDIKDNLVRYSKKKQL